MPLAARFRRFDTFIFDLDGTVWYWTKAVRSAADVFKALEREGKKYFFITNNTCLRLEGYAKKLKQFGIAASAKMIFNPTLAAIKLFRYKRIFCIGENGLKYELKKSGIMLTNKRCDAVLIGDDRTLTYSKMERAVYLASQGAKLYKTAEGGKWIMGDIFTLGAGAIAHAIEFCTGKKAELIGKPTRHMASVIPKLNGETIFFGDEHKSDIVFGKKLGFATCLVLTGIDRKHNIKHIPQPFKPDYVIKGIWEILG